MSTTSPDLCAQVAAAVLHQLEQHYALPAAGATAATFAGCQTFLQELGALRDDAAADDDPAVALRRRVDPLIALAALTADPGAALLLVGSFLSQCEEQSGRPTPAAVRQRALLDMATVTRILMTEAVGRAEEAAKRDRSTGLLNREGTFERLTSLLADGPAGQRLGVLCIDIRPGLEGLSRVGHPALEALMQTLAARIRGKLRSRDADNIGRSGPLQFQVLLAGLAFEKNAINAAQKLAEEALRAPVQAGGLEILPNAAIGVSTAPSLGQTAEALLDQAMVAMHDATRVSDEYREYDPAMADGAAGNDRLVVDLAAAIATNHEDLSLYFQPQLNLQTGRIESAEALFRWKTIGPDGEVVVRSPDRTLLTTEAIGKLGSLSHYLVSQAVQQISEWQRRHGITITVAVNLPAPLLKDGLQHDVKAALVNFAVPPALLMIEITEGSMIRFGNDMDAARQILQDLKDVGVRLAIDDFGTGYSSLAWLKNLPFDEVKVDQMFVRGMTSCARSPVIVSNVVRLAHELGMEVVVEGVEDRATWERVKAMGAERIQGYALARPLPEADFRAFVQAFHADGGKVA